LTWSVLRTIAAGNRHLQQQETATAREVAARTSDLFMRTLVAVDSIDLSPLPADRAAADRWLAQQLKVFRLEPWLGLRVEAPDGTVLATAGARTYTDHAHGTRAGILECHVCLQTHHAIPIRSRPGASGRVLEARIALETLAARYLGGAGAEAAREIWVLDEANTVIASTDSAEIATQPFLGAKPELRAALAGASGSATSFRVAGAQRVFGVARLPIRGSPFRVVVAANPAHATHALRGAIYAQAGAALMLLAAVLFGAWRWLEERRRGWAAERSALDARRVAEERAARADRLATVGVLAASVAHEVNNALSYISTNVAYVREELETLPQLDATLMEALDDAHDGGERVQEIVDALRSLSRHDESTHEPVDVRRAVISALRIAAGQIKSRAVVVEDLREVPPVMASAGRLSQVILNLLINAAHAVGDDGSASAEICARTYREGDQVVIEIEDTGSGIPPAVQARIFEPFFTTKPAGVGTGLGLDICRDIIQSFAGRISVDSVVGKGSVFRVELPVAPAAEASAYAEHADAPNSVPPSGEGASAVA